MGFLGFKSGKERKVATLRKNRKADQGYKKVSKTKNDASRRRLRKHTGNVRYR